METEAGFFVQTDEQILAARVTPPAPLEGRIRIVEYDDMWPALYAREAVRIRNTLGAKVLLLEHVGSTSVPGLAAKPRIDVLLAVKNSAEEESYVPQLKSAGYELTIREPDWFEHRCLNGPDADMNLHVFTVGCDEIDRMLLFRERLRSNPDDRKLYERTKRDLASREWKYTQNYADAKTEDVLEIMGRALAAQT